MITYETTITIKHGDIVWNRDDLYKVIRRVPKAPCSCQCAMWNVDRKRCNGFCYKFYNGGADGDFVFKRITNRSLPEDAVIKETEFQRDCRLYNILNTIENGNSSDI